MMEEVARIADLEIEYVIRETWQEIFESVRSGTADLIPNQGITEERMQWFSFSPPVETFPVSIFTRASGDDISTQAGLSGKRVAVVRLNIGETLAAAETGVRVIPYDHIQDALFALLSGNADALIFPEPVLWKLAREAGIEDRLKVSGPPLTEIRRGISVAKGNSALLARINPAVDQLLASLTYQAIYTKWYGSPPPFWTVPKVAAVMANVLIAVLLGMGIWRYHSVVKLNRRLSESIEQRERAERRLQESYDTLEQKVGERTRELREALSEVNTLSGLLPICSNCKRIRDDKGYWNQIEAYIQAHSQAEFTHSICRECARKLYPELYSDEKER